MTTKSSPSSDVGSSTAGISKLERGVALSAGGSGDGGIDGTRVGSSDLCCGSSSSDFGTLTSSHSVSGTRGEEGVRGVRGLEGGSGGV